MPETEPFEFSSHVRYSEVDHHGALTLPAIIDYFQDCSTFQSEQLGLGMKFLASEQKAWVLTHWHIVIERYPLLCEPIVVGTFASDFRGLIAHRNFYLRQGSDKLLVRANSSWAFMDLAKNRPARPTPEHIEPYGTHKPLAMPAESRKIAIPDNLVTCEPFTIQRHHIDMNNHVNNCEYIQMALDRMDCETPVTSVRVDYKRAACLGDTVVASYARTADRLVVDLHAPDGATYAVVELGFGAGDSADAPHA